MRRTSHARTRSGSHVATRPPSCFKTRKRARPASRLGPARPARRLLRTAGGDGVGAARLCCLPSCPRCPSTIEAVPACGRSWVWGGWWAAEARRAQLGVACLCCVIPCCAAAAALPPATSASRVSTWARRAAAACGHWRGWGSGLPAHEEDVVDDAEEGSRHLPTNMRREGEPSSPPARTQVSLPWHLRHRRVLTSCRSWTMKTRDRLGCFCAAQPSQIEGQCGGSGA